jgi:hypothetical protein
MAEPIENCLNKHFYEYYLATFFASESHQIVKITVSGSYAQLRFRVHIAEWYSPRFCRQTSCRGSPAGLWHPP